MQKILTISDQPHYIEFTSDFIFISVIMFPAKKLEVFMSIKHCFRFAWVVLCVVMLSPFCAVSQTDIPGSKDHPMCS